MNLKKKNFFLFCIISFSIGPSFWSERWNIPLFLLILTGCIPYGIRGEEKHSTTPWGTLKKKKRKLFFELQPKWIRKRVTSIILLSSIFCLSLFHLVKFHARSLFKKVRPNPTNKTRINYESWFFKECLPSFIPDYPLFYFLFITYYAN